MFKKRIAPNKLILIKIYKAAYLEIIFVNPDI
jgi:hypothetical protein